MRKILITLAALAAFTAALASDQAARGKVADLHKAQGVSCEDCHDKGPRKVVEMEKCLTCHESYPKVAERTKGLKPNPHDSHLMELDCLSCHHGHKAFELYCSTCHGDMKFEKK